MKGSDRQAGHQSDVSVGLQIAGVPAFGHPRWESPTLADVEKARLEDVKAVIAPVLANAPIEVTMVGDVTVEQATKAVAATFGALPPRTPASFAQPSAGDVHFRRPPRSLSCSSPRSRGSGRRGDRLADNGCVCGQGIAARRLLVNVMQSRLMEQLRMNAGATYSPQTTAHASLTFPGYGYIGAMPNCRRTRFSFSTTRCRRSRPTCGNMARRLTSSSGPGSRKSIR